MAVTRVCHKHDGLFDEVATFGALHAAARKAVKGKRKKAGRCVFRPTPWHLTDLHNAAAEDDGGQGTRPSGGGCRKLAHR